MGPVAVLDRDFDILGLFHSYEPPKVTSKDDSSSDEEEWAHSDVRELMAVRLPRSVQAHCYAGDLLAAIHGTHRDETKNWDRLPANQREQYWHDEFRMCEDTFDELFNVVEMHFQARRAINGHFQAYSKRTRLMLTLNWLAHMPTSRQMQHKWGVPHNTVTACILRPVIKALYKVLVVDAETSEIVWPSTPHGIQGVVDGFRTKYGLPGCAGAIDGSLIPMKKPLKKQVGGDADAFWGYKGYICSLLLAVVDSDKLFRYVHCGAPACLGDAGLFSRSVLKRSIDNGVLEQVDVPLVVDGQVQYIHPYLVGDAAFGLTAYMQKNFNPPPGARSQQAVYNKKVTDCRRRVEVTFGELKGRWACCRRNTFWNDIEFLSEVTSVCCALHNYLTRRGAAYMGEWGNYQEQYDPGPLPVLQNNQPAGNDVRNLLVAHLSNM